MTKKKLLEQIDASIETLVRLRAFVAEDRRDRFSDRRATIPPEYAHLLGSVLPEERRKGGRRPGPGSLSK